MDEEFGNRSIKWNDFFKHGTARDVLFPRGSNRAMNLEENHAADYQQ